MTQKITSTLGALALAAALVAGGNRTADASSHREAPFLFGKVHVETDVATASEVPAGAIAVAPVARGPSAAPAWAPTLFASKGLHPFFAPMLMTMPALRWFVIAPGR